MFLARDVQWRNKIVSTFREAGFPEGEQQWGLLAMSAFGISDIWSERICQHLRTRTGPPAAHRLDTRRSRSPVRSSFARRGSPETTRKARFAFFSQAEDGIRDHFQPAHCAHQC